MTSLLKKLSIRTSSKTSSSPSSNSTTHGTPEVTTHYDDYDERYEQQYRQSVQKQKDVSGASNQRPSLLNVGPGCGTPGNAGRHPSQVGLGDIPVPEERLERDLELDERVSAERGREGGGR